MVAAGFNPLARKMILSQREILPSESALRQRTLAVQQLTVGDFA